MAPTQHRSIRPDLMHRHAYQVAHLISTFTVPMMRDLYRRFDGDMMAFSETVVFIVGRFRTKVCFD